MSLKDTQSILFIIANVLATALQFQKSNFIQIMGNWFDFFPQQPKENEIEIC